MPLPTVPTTEQEYLQALGLGDYIPPPQPTFRSNLAAAFSDLQPPPQHTGFGANALYGLAHGFSAAQSAAQARADEIRKMQNVQRLQASTTYREGLAKKIFEPTDQQKAALAGAEEAARLKAKEPYNPTKYPAPGRLVQRLQSQGMTDVPPMTAEDRGALLKQEFPAEFNASLAMGDPLADAANPTLRQWARRYAVTGDFGPMGMGSAGLRMRIAQVAQAMYPDLDIAKSRANYTAKSATLKEMVSARYGVEAFSNTFKANYEQMLSTVATRDPKTGRMVVKIPNSSPILNTPMRALMNQLGSDQIAQFEAARRVVVPEAARVLTQAKLGATPLTDQAQRDIEAVIDGGYNLRQLLGVYKILSGDVLNRAKSYDDQIAKLQREMVPWGSTGPLEPIDAPPPLTPTAEGPQTMVKMARTKNGVTTVKFVPKDRVDEMTKAGARVVP